MDKIETIPNTKKLDYNDDGDLLFIPRVVAVGASRPSAKTEMVADAALNGGKEGIVITSAFNTVYIANQ